MSGREREGGELRRSAEERLRRRGPRRAAGTDADARRLLHELEVHELELELQNEELRSARLDTEAALRRFTELFDFAPVGYFAVAPDGVIREVNFEAARLLGAERGRVLGRTLVSFVALRDVQVFERFLADVLASSAGEDPSRACEIILRPAGSDASSVVRLTGAVLDGPVALVAAEDVTARRRAEAALREEGHRKDDFLAALSHELRNPLAPIRSALAMLTRVPPGSDQSRRAREVLERQVAHLAHLVEDLLDVTRLARGKVHLRRERVEVADLVRRTVEDHRATFEAAGIELGAALPRERCWVDVDATRCAQVLGNLLVNAAKFTVRGGRVDVVARREGASVAMTVRDTGVGIAPEVRARLFEPFAQAPQTIDRSRGGLGLGLATVKGLVELHGGTVTVRSDGPGQGSEFTVRLPAAEPPVDHARAPQPARGGSRRVLVIDDNADAATMLKEILELSGHDVRVALDGPAGIALARAFGPEVVLCDIGLPGMDGYAVARTLRADERTRGAYLVALSGYALPDDLRRATEAGFDRHLAKPPLVETLERLIDERSPAASVPP